MARSTYTDAELASPHLMVGALSALLEGMIAAAEQGGDSGTIKRDVYAKHGKALLADLEERRAAVLARAA